MYDLLEENNRRNPRKYKHLGKIYGVIITLFGMLVIYAIIRFNEFANSALTSRSRDVDPSAPLSLTALIESASAVGAREAAKVQHTLFGNTRTYTGYLNVNKTYDKNLFMWFCPSEGDYDNDPVILWLQGGPGGSSLFGLFREHGPFKIQEDSIIANNKFSWTKKNSMLYIDNPAGTGYSYTKSSGYDSDEKQIGLELLEAIRQFFLIFPELKDNDFFIAGESYAGKYIPATAYEILQKNLKSGSTINLKGLAIGNGKIDPVNQLDIGEFAFQHGLVDSNTKRKLNELKKKVESLMEEKKFREATELYYKMSELLKEQTGFTNLYNYLYPNRDTYLDDVEAFVQIKDVRTVIHVGSTKFNNGEQVAEALDMDGMKSVADLLPPLLENYRILFYNGQLDARLPYPCMVNFLEKLKFNAAEEYKTAERKIWRVGEDIAGYSKKAGNMTELLVRDAGHMVPVDQPEWAFDMIMRFTRNKAFE